MQSPHLNRYLQQESLCERFENDKGAGLSRIGRNLRANLILVFLMCVRKIEEGIFIF
jgi:hypothetical protein